MQTILKLKPYLESIQKHCKILSKDNLHKFIEKLAQEIEPEKRRDFLETFESFDGEEKIIDFDANTNNDFVNSIIKAINNLKTEIIKRIESIENGEYYDSDDWDTYGYEDNADCLSEDQKEAMKNLFLQADSFFLDGDLSSANQIYEALLDLFNIHTGGFMSELNDYDLEIEWLETRARHYRCIYELSLPEERVEKLLKAMTNFIEKGDSDYDHYLIDDYNHPLLQDIIDAKLGILPNFQDFLRNLQNALKEKNNQRALILFLETIYFLDGIDEVGTEVKKRNLHIGYLYWLQKLITQAKWNEIILVANEALSKIPNGYLRKEIAKILFEAAQKIQNQASMLKGKQEQFYSDPEDETFKELVVEAVKQNLKNETLQQALIILIKDHRENTINLQVKILLMLGDLQSAFKLINKTEYIGWSSDTNGTAIFVASLMSALVQTDNKCKLIKKLLEDYSSYHFGISDSKIIAQEIENSVKNIEITDSDKKTWLDFLKQIIGSRIDEIVSSQKRKAYDNAAECLGALMETFVSNNMQNESNDLREFYRNNKYRQYSAFKAEVDKAVKFSGLV